MKRPSIRRASESIALKSLSGIVVLLVVFSAIVCVIGYRGFTRELMAQYAEGAFLTADTAALYVDPDKLDEYEASEGDSEEYRKTWLSLDQLCNSSGATFIYVIRPDRTDYAHITFLFSTVSRQAPYTRYGFGFVRETTNDEYREKYRALYEGNARRELVIRDDGNIETDRHITAMIPLKDENQETQAILCVQRQMSGMAQARGEYIQKVVLVLALLSLVVIFGQGFYLNRMLLVPVKTITDEASRFATENVKRNEKLRETITNRDEIGILAGAIDQMEEQIHNYVTDLTRATAEKERINTEMTMASRIQAHMLPNNFPAFPEHTEFDIYASMDPARGVGGDFYDFFLVDDDHLCLVIADVSGKGIPAALFMMVSKVVLSENALLGKSPAEVLRNTNNAICSNNKEEMFVTVWLGILELSTGILTASNAGHEYPILQREDGTFKIVKDDHGLVVGAMEDVTYKDYELRLAPGSRIFLYTDGVTEASDAEENMFGQDRLLTALNEMPHEDPEHLIGHVKGSIESFVNGAEQFDDVTMLCLEYRGPADMSKE